MIYPESKMKSFINRCSRYSTRLLFPACPSDLQKHIHFSNKIALLLIVIASPCLFIFAMISPFGYGVSINLALFLCCILFNYKGAYILGRYSLLLSANFGVFFFADLFGPGLGIQFILIPFLCLPATLFSNDEKLHIKIGLLLPLVCLFALEATHYNLIPPLSIPPTIEHWVYLLDLSLICLFMLVFALIDVSTTTQFSKQLQYAYRKLEEAKTLSDHHYQSQLANKEQLLSEAQKKTSLMHLLNEYNHDIKAPLMVLKMQAQRNLSPEVLSTHINTQVTHVESLVQKMHDIIRERSVIIFEPLDLNEVIQETLTLFPLRISSKTIELLDIPFIKGDKIELQLLFINLFKNIIEASVQNSFESSVTIRSFLDPVHTNVIISIEDTCGGIPPAIINNVWNNDISSSEHLGLSIIRRIVTEHNGHIDLKTTDKGTLFKLSFPTQNATSVTAPDPTLSR